MAQESSQGLHPDLPFREIDPETQTVDFGWMAWIEKMDAPDDRDIAWHYREFSIPKRGGGFRKISEPRPFLKTLQKRILEHLYLLEQADFPECAPEREEPAELRALQDIAGSGESAQEGSAGDYFSVVSRTPKYDSRMFKGPPVNLIFKEEEIRIRRPGRPLDGICAYRPGKSVCRNAGFHIGSATLIKTDIRDFFPSCTTEKVRQIFQGFLVKLGKKRTGIAESDRPAGNLAALCCLNGALPQGAPTSGYLANLVLQDADLKIFHYCRRNGLRYSRYSDDITISGDSKGKPAATKIVRVVSRILKSHGFLVNRRKTRVLGKGTRQMVTGVVVNEKRSVPRPLKRFLRQQWYYFLKFGTGHLDRTGGESLKAFLIRFGGKTSWILQVERRNREFRKIRLEWEIVTAKWKEGLDIDQAIEAMRLRLGDRPRFQETPSGIVIGDIEWKTCNEVSPAAEAYKERGENELFSFSAMLQHLTTEAKEGWRLPTTAEFLAMLESTRYRDSKRLGQQPVLPIPLSGYANPFLFVRHRERRKTGYYWTGEAWPAATVPGGGWPRPECEPMETLAHGVFVLHSEDRKHRKTVSTGNLPYRKMNNFALEQMVPLPEIRKRNLRYRKMKNFAGQGRVLVFTNPDAAYHYKFTLRLVRDLNWRPGPDLFADGRPAAIYRSAKPVLFHAPSRNLNRIPDSILEDKRWEHVYLPNNRFESLDFLRSRCIRSLDASNNRLQSFSLRNFPNVRHVHLKGNLLTRRSLYDLRFIAEHVHEFTADPPVMAEIERFAKLGNVFPGRGIVSHEIAPGKDISELFAHRNLVRAICFTFDPLDPGGMLDWECLSSLYEFPRLESLEFRVRRSSGELAGMADRFASQREIRIESRLTPDGDFPEIEIPMDRIDHPSLRKLKLDSGWICQLRPIGELPRSVVHFFADNFIRMVRLECPPDHRPSVYLKNAGFRGYEQFTLRNPLVEKDDFSVSEIGELIECPENLARLFLSLNYIGESGVEKGAIINPYFTNDRTTDPAFSSIPMLPLAIFFNTWKLSVRRLEDLFYPCSHYNVYNVHPKMIRDRIWEKRTKAVRVYGLPRAGFGSFDYLDYVMLPFLKHYITGRRTLDSLVLPLYPGSQDCLEEPGDEPPLAQHLPEEGGNDIGDPGPGRCESAYDESDEIPF